MNVNPIHLHYTFLYNRIFNRFWIIFEKKVNICIFNILFIFKTIGIAYIINIILFYIFKVKIWKNKFVLCIV